MEPEARQPSPNLATVAHLSSPKVHDASQKWVKVVRLSSPKLRYKSPKLATVAHLSSPKLRSASQKLVKVAHMSSLKLCYKSPKLATVAHLSSPKLCYESLNGRTVPLVCISRINNKPGKEIKGKKHPPNR